MSSSPVRPLTVASSDRRLRVLVLAAWAAVAAVAAIQTAALVRLQSPHPDLLPALLRRLSILPLWAAATPLVLSSARRFPLRGVAPRSAAAHAALHLLFGSAFVFAANVVIRVPLFVSGAGLDVAGLSRATALGVATYYPAAMVVYGIIVGLGHVVAARVGEAPAIPVAPSPVAACLTLRQWNRTHLVRLDDVDWIEAEDNDVVVHAGGRSYRTRERIGTLETQLDPRAFVRIHRSSIVSVARIREVQPLGHGDHAVILRCGRVLRVARTRRAALADALGVEL